MPVIDSITSGDQNIPGSYSLDLASSGMTLSDKYNVGASAVATPIFPGLFVGRNNVGTNFITAEPLSEIGTPGPEDILGVVAWQIYGAQTSSSLSYLEMTPISQGQKIQIMQDMPGWIKVFAGEAIDGTKTLAVAATTTGTGANIVYAGSLVNSDFAAGPLVELAGLASINPMSNGATYAKGDLVPLSLQIINR